MWRAANVERVANMANVANVARVLRSADVTTVPAVAGLWQQHVGAQACSRKRQVSQAKWLD